MYIPSLYINILLINKSYECISYNKTFVLIVL